MTMREFLDRLSIYTKYFDEEELAFYENLKANQKVTEKGTKILLCMKENEEKYLNIFSSKQLGELLSMPPRSVSGSLKKLVADGYAEKKSVNPVTYGITSKGKELELD